MKGHLITFYLNSELPRTCTCTMFSLFVYLYFTRISKDLIIFVFIRIPKEWCLWELLKKFFSVPRTPYLGCSGGSRGGVFGAEGAAGRGQSWRGSALAEQVCLFVYKTCCFYWSRSQNIHCSRFWMCFILTAWLSYNTPMIKSTHLMCIVWWILSKSVNCITIYF